MKTLLLIFCALTAGALAPDKSRWDYLGSWRDLVFVRQPAAFEDMSIGAYRRGDLEFTLNWDQFHAMYWPMRYVIRPERVENPDFWEHGTHEDDGSHGYGGPDGNYPWLTAKGIIYR